MHVERRTHAPTHYYEFSNSQAAENPSTSFKKVQPGDLFWDFLNAERDLNRDRQPTPKLRMFYFGDGGFNRSAQHLLILRGNEFGLRQRKRPSCGSDGRTGKVLRPSHGRWKGWTRPALSGSSFTMEGLLEEREEFSVAVQ
jgi:hypothetical protein